MEDTFKHRVAAVIFFLLFIVFAFIVFGFFTRKSLDIIAPANADIYIKYSSADVFELAGKGKVDIGVGDNKIVYIKVEEGDKTTITGVGIAGRSNTVSVNLRDLSAGNKLIDIGLANIKVDGDVIFGLNPSSQRLLSYELTPPFDQANFYIGLPDIEKVLWESASKYIYVAPLAGITTVEGSNRNILEGAVDIAYLDGIYYIVALDGLYASSWPGSDSAIEKIVDKQFGSGARVHVSGDKILVSSPVEDVADEIFQSQDFIGSTLEVFDKNGQAISETNIDTFGVTDAAVLADSRLFVASDNTLSVYSEGGDLLPEYSYVISAQDIDLHNGKPVILSDSEGVIMFEDDQYKYIQQDLFGERYISSSLASSDGSLFYATRLPGSSLDIISDTRPGVYKVDF